MTCGSPFRCDTCRRPSRDLCNTYNGVLTTFHSKKKNKKNVQVFYLFFSWQFFLTFPMNNNSLTFSWISIKCLNPIIFLPLKYFSNFFRPSSTIGKFKIHRDLLKTNSVWKNFRLKWREISLHLFYYQIMWMGSISSPVRQRWECLSVCSAVQTNKVKFMKSPTSQHVRLERIYIHISLPQNHWQQNHNMS